MNKRYLIFVVFFLLSIGFVNAVYEYNWTDLSATNSGDWAVNGSAVYSLAFDSVNGLVYTGSTYSVSDSWIGVYNLSSNVWSGIKNNSAYISIFSMIFDSSRNMIFYSMGIQIGIYNVSSNISSSYYPFGGGSSVYSLAFDSVDNMVYVGSNLGRLGVYNLSNNSFTDLSTTDAGNWAGASNTQINSLLYVNGLVYTGGTMGKFGVYNISSNVWSDLSATDTANWVANGFTQTMTYDAVNDLVYTSGQYLWVGVYNRSSNVWSKSFNNPTTGGGTTSLIFDSINNLFYISAISPAYFGVYNPVLNTTTNLNYTSLGLSPVYSMALANNGLYTGSSNMTFGVLNWSSPCVETWVKNVNTCDSLNKQVMINYTDTHQCGTSNTVPIDNGTYEYCCIPSWGLNNSVCDGSSYTRNYFDVYSCGNVSSLPVDNGTVLSCALDNSTYIFEQLPFNSTGVISLTSDPVHNLLYIGSGNSLLPFSVYNLSNNVFTDLSSTDTANFWATNQINSLYYDSVYDLVYTGTAGKFGVYNRSSNVWSDLSATDTKLITGGSLPNWAGTQQVTSIAGDVNGLIYTGLTGGLFGVYNVSSNTWYSLSLQDAGNWAGTLPLTSLSVDSVNGMVYTGFQSGGKFGVYNASSLAWLDLSATDPSNWIGTNALTSLAFDSNHNLVYFITNNNILGVYNPITNLSINISYFSALSNARISYDSVNDLLYTIGQLGRVGVYNPSTNTWSGIKDINRWMNIMSIPSITVVNGSVYVGTASSTADGQLGRRVLVSCIENWLPSDSSCNGFTYTVGYYDSNSCGTSTYVPFDNGTTQRCNFNYVLDTWYDLSMTDKLPEFNWLSTGTAYPIGIFNSSMYFATAINGFSLSKYNPLTNIFSIVANNSFSANPLLVGDVIYTTSSPPINFGVYNLSNNVFTDLSATDPLNWSGVYSTQSFAKVNNLIFTRMSAPAGFFGVYNISDGVWYNSSIISGAMSRNFTNGNNVMLGDSANNLLYIGLSRYPTTPPNIGALGIYNISNNSLDIYTFYNSSLGASTINDMVLVNDTVYLGYGSISGMALVSFNTSNKSFTSFSTADVGDWVNTSSISVHGLAYDSVHNIIYTSLGNKFGVFNISSNVWLNHSILGNSSIGDVLPTNLNHLVFDSVHEVLYAGDNGGFHLYKTPYVPLCSESWISSDTSCNGLYYTKLYYDSNSCGTTASLPVNNGTTVSCISSGSPVYLGVATNFSIVAQTTITDATPSTSLITGSVSINPNAGSFITGVSCSRVNGNIFDNNGGYLGGFDSNTSCLVTNASTTLAVESAMMFAYNDARGRSNPNFTELNSGHLGGLTLTSGLYKWSSAVDINNDLILDCLGDVNAVFIFQGSQTLGLTSGKRVNLTGGCQAGNIFWQFDTAVTLGTYSHFEGSILSGTAITVQSGATVNGRLFGQTAVTLDSNHVTLPVLLYCIPIWVQNSPMNCNGVLPNFTVSYSDFNMCNISTNLPVNNGTVTSCCVEHFVQNNTACTGYSFVAGYIDLNSCGTSFTLPSDNHLTLPCTLEARTSGGTGGNSILVDVPQSFFSNESSMPSNMITEEFVLVRWWNSFVIWITGWWNS